MSLVFLKDRTEYEDYDVNPLRAYYKWENTFNTPLELPPNSQVAYISSTIPLEQMATLNENNNSFFIQVGIPGLNATNIIKMDTGTFSSFPAFIQAVNEALNNWNIQGDFNTDAQTLSSGVLVNNNGWRGVFSNTNFKLNIRNIQRKTNPNKTGGYNVSLPNQVSAAINMTNELGWYRFGSTNGGFTWSGLTYIPPAAPSININNIGWNVNRWNNALDISIAGNVAGPGDWGICMSKTGIKHSGLALGNAGDFNQVLTQCRILTAPQAHNPVIAGNGVCEIIQGWVPYSWVEASGPDTNSYAEDVNDFLINSPLGTLNGGNSYFMFGLAVNNQGDIDIIMNDGTLTTPVYTLIDQFDPTTLVPAPVVPTAQNITYRWTWIDCYSLKLEAATDYDQDANTATWTLLWDMATGQTANLAAGPNRIRQIPSYLGDLRYVGYSAYTAAELRVRGNFDNLEGFRALPFEENLYETFNCAEKSAIRDANGVGGLTTEALTNADGMMEKEINFCFNKITAAADLTNYGYPIVYDTVNGNAPIALTPVIPRPFVLDTPHTDIGEIFGFGNTSNVFLDQDVAGVFSAQSKEGTNAVQTSKNINSIHIQLTNLPILSKNAMIQNSVKDIAVVPCYDSDRSAVDNLNNIDVFYNQANDKHWVDLNNFGNLTLNRLDCYMTYDNNKPAVNIKDKPEVLVMFRQKPSYETGLPINIQTNAGMNNPYTSSTQSFTN